jgi:hypothetical protein
MDTRTAGVFSLNVQLAISLGSHLSSSPLFSLMLSIDFVCAKHQ